MILKQFDNRDKLEKKLAKKIAGYILEGILLNGKANILLSGGSTPLKLYELLGEYGLDWSKVNVGLVDERFVSPTSEHNNHKKIEEALNKNSADKITVLPMVVDEMNMSSNLSEVKELYKPFFEKIDFTLLGMGEDGHTASLFPGDPESISMLADTKKDIRSSLAPVFPETRISCNKKLLLSSNHIGLMILGMKKIKILQESIENNLPISEFSDEKNELKVYFTA